MRLAPWPRCAVHHDGMDGYWPFPENEFHCHPIHLWLTGEDPRRDPKSSALNARIFGRFKNKVWILMPVPKLLNANCDLMKVTTNDLNVKCAIVQPFQSMWAFKLSCCIKTIGFLTSQKRLCSPRIYSSAEVHTSKLAMRIDLNQKASRIKDLLFGPQGGIYLLILR